MEASRTELKISLNKRQAEAGGQSNMGDLKELL